jgi:hypothetical protein
VEHDVQFSAYHVTPSLQVHFSKGREAVARSIVVEDIDAFQRRSRLVNPARSGIRQVEGVAPHIVGLRAQSCCCALTLTYV